MSCSDAPKIRVGIIGVGFGEQVLLPAFRTDPRVDVSAIAASKLERADRVARAHGVARAFAGWGAIVEDAALDAIAIATPPAEQPRIAIAAMTHGKHVFCEKPAADSLAGAASMLEMASRSGVANMVDFIFPEIRAWKRAKEIIDGGEIGIVHHAAVNWNVETYAVRHGLKSWKTDRSAGGGILNNFVSHCFYYLEWLLGPIRTVSCTMRPDPADKHVEETHAIIGIKFDSGATAALSVSSDAVPPSGHRVEIYGGRGALRLENSTSDYAKGFTLWWGTRESGVYHQIESDESAMTASGADGRITAVSMLVKRFCDWIETGSPAVPTLQHGLRGQTLLDSTFRSALEQRTIDVRGGVQSS